MANVLIVGGGIIGLSSAYYLVKGGHTVTIVDKGNLVNNCSSGNAGMIVPSHFIPLAAPGMISQGIRWMFNSKSPFYVKPSFNLELFSWGLKFLKHATKQHVENAAIPLRDLSLFSRALYSELSEYSQFEFGLKHKGILTFFKTPKAQEEEIYVANKGNELGLEMDVLSIEECRKLQPSLKLNALGAVHYKCDAHLYPNQLIQNLISYLEKKNVKIIKGFEVTHIAHSKGKIQSVVANNERLEADEFVFAGGSWSPVIAKMANLNVPLLPGKGYSFMEDEPENRLTIPALLSEARVAVTPMNGQIRYGGTMELDRINSKINRNRLKGIVEAIPAYFPELNPKMPNDKDVWFGFRPVSPDGLPYIGRSEKYANLSIATGHGMMGLSLGPATGKLISEIIEGKQTSVDVLAFKPDRF